MVITSLTPGTLRIKKDHLEVLVALVLLDDSLLDQELLLIGGIFFVLTRGAGSVANFFLA
jgi:hypothetical protein